MSENPSNQFARSLSGIQTRLHGYIFSLVRDLSDTDDLFQQTATILWKKIDQYESKLVYIATDHGREQIRDLIRKEIKNSLDNENLFDPEDQVLLKQFIEKLRKELSK